MKRSGSDTPSCVWCGIELTEEGLCADCVAAWPKCAVPACQNKCCLRLKSIYCWPHTPGVDQEEVDASLAEDDSFEDTNVEDSYAR